MKPDVPLSEEQAAAFNSISNKKSASIDACAGSGKSHTTRAMARAYGGPVLTMPFSRALAEAEREAFKGRDNINSINFHAAGRRLSGDCEVDNSKLKRLANGDEKMEKAIELCTMLKNEAVGTFSDSLNPAEVAKKYGFNSDLINPAIQLLALSDADKKSVDFADMLRFPVLQGRTNLVSKNTLVLLDEVQDYTPASFEFLTKCIAPKGSLIATVGDKDRQALQQFCGATPKLFDSISDFYECEKMQITFNRRCAKKIVSNAPFKGDMKALPDAPEGEISALSQSEVIEAALKGEYSKDAIISETNAPLVLMGIQMLTNGIPVQMRTARLEGQILRYVGFKLLDLRFTKIGEIAIKARQAYAEKFPESENAEAEDVFKAVEALELYCMANNLTKVSWMKKNGRNLPVNPIIQALNRLCSCTNGITLLTGHSSKGLEWEKVFYLPGKMKPSKADWQLHQSNCLAHVISTRAKTSYISLV